MRKLGVIIFLIGSGIALLWPWVQLNFQNDIIKTVELRGLTKNGSAEAILDLERSDNPVRIRFVAHYKVDVALPPLKIPMIVKISDRDGTLVGTITSFATPKISSGPEQPTQRAGQPLNFDIVNDGPHALSMSYAENNNNGGITRPDIDFIEATFIRNASPIDNQYKMLGIVIAVLGFYLIFRSRRRGKKQEKKARWGRGN